jgi:hypothetical protein
LNNTIVKELAGKVTRNLGSKLLLYSYINHYGDLKVGVSDAISVVTKKSGGIGDLLDKHLEGK